MANPLRKTLEYLGLVEEGPVADAQAAPQATASPSTNATAPAGPTGQKASVTHIRRGPRAAGEQLNEIVTVHPKRYADVQAVAQSFRDGIPVIINLSQMTESDARRLVDFSSGLAQGLYGKIERVTPKVFLLSPVNVAVTNEEGTDEVDDAEDQAPAASGFFS